MPKKSLGDDTPNIIEWVKRGLPIADYTALYQEGGREAVTKRLRIIALYAPEPDVP